jgi:peptide-methionine (S)-S-oxide reductase
MRPVILRIAALVALAMPATSAQAAPISPPAKLDTLVVAGGCFWGVQAVFQHVNGVVKATSGYSGGTVVKPDYEDVSTGRTGHAEVVRVIYDPAKVPLQKLLEVFFVVAHDPTQLNRQGPDVGTQYRSAIFYTNDAQKSAVQSYIGELTKTGAVRGKVVTQIAPLSAFYVAEDYHQDYATLHPDQPYIVYHDLPKIAALKQRYPGLWAEKKAGY